MAEDSGGSADLIEFDSFDPNEGEGKGKNAGATVLDGEDIPEAYRGKTATEIIKLAESARGGMNDALTMARDAAQASQRAAETSARRDDPPKEAEKPLTREQLKEIYDEDPIKALEIMEAQAMTRLQSHVDARLAPLAEGTMSSAENWARQEYGDEFSLFEEDIKKMVNSIGNKALFGTHKGWEDTIAYVRGQKGNFEKLIDHRANKVNESARDSARQGQRQGAGFTAKNTRTGTSTPTGTGSMEGMSAEESTIVQRFISNGTFKDVAEYRRWQRAGGS